MCPFKNKIDKTEYSKNYKIEQRRIAINYYSNGKMCCECCGEKQYKFLAIDHINGGGRKHVLSIKNPNIAFWLIKNKFPKGFRILCHNCNIGRNLNNGICPHKVK